MQVFRPYKNPKKIAKILDKRRHNNQVNEATIIMKVHTGLTHDWKDPNAWKNHSNVVIWDGSQIFWLYKYTKILLKTYSRKYKIPTGIRLFKLYVIYDKLKQKYKKPLFIKRPKFINKDSCNEHKQLLLLKDYKHYSRYF